MLMAERNLGERFQTLERYQIACEKQKKMRFVVNDYNKANKFYKKE